MDPFDVLRDHDVEAAKVVAEQLPVPNGQEDSDKRDYYYFDEVG